MCDVLIGVVSNLYRVYRYLRLDSTGQWALHKILNQFTNYVFKVIHSPVVITSKPLHSLNSLKCSNFY